MNPYHVPGMNSGGPLCPFTHPEHEGYYVPVDDTQKSYDQFAARIGDPERLLAEGRLVVALGPERCGKTSLLNRCAAWVRAELKARKRRCLILSLTEESPPAEGVEKRELHVFQCVIDDLRSRELFSLAQLEELEKRKDSLNLGYRYLSDIIPDDVVLIILLPPSELEHELDRYARNVRKRLLFLAESSLERLDQARHQRTIQLKVGPLHEDDGWIFANARQALHADEPDAPDYPKVSEATMGLVTDGWDVSIGQLQDLLYGVYREILEQPEREDAAVAFETGEVSFEQILKFHFRRSRDQARIYE